LQVYETVYANWFPVNTVRYAAGYTMTPIRSFAGGQEMILVFGAGIQYGMRGPDGQIEPVPFAVSARILKSV